MSDQSQLNKRYNEKFIDILDQLSNIMLKQGEPFKSRAYQKAQETIMAYPNDYLISHGINANDVICFKPDSEYEFTVDGEKMYRMFDHQITIIL